jgi:hypothetical protein
MWTLTSQSGSCCKNISAVCVVISVLVRIFWNEHRLISKPTSLWFSFIRHLRIRQRNQKQEFSFSGWQSKNPLLSCLTLKRTSVPCGTFLDWFYGLLWVTRDNYWKIGKLWMKFKTNYNTHFLIRQNSMKRDECEINFMRTAERSAHSTAPIVNNRRITFVTLPQSEIER